MLAKVAIVGNLKNTSGRGHSFFSSSSSARPPFRVGEPGDPPRPADFGPTSPRRASIIVMLSLMPFRMTNFDSARVTLDHVASPHERHVTLMPTLRVIRQSQ